MPNFSVSACLETGFFLCRAVSNFFLCPQIQFQELHAIPSLTKPTRFLSKIIRNGFKFFHRVYDPDGTRSSTT
jgi:hypothetical protein